MQRRMISDSLLVLGIILAVTGWRGIGSEGWIGITSIGLLLAGILLGGLGLVRYIRGHDDPKE